jgi:hypothetical protein
VILVRQLNHETCQQACVAMLAGVTIEEVIGFIGDKALGTAERHKCHERFGIGRPSGASWHMVDAVEHTLAKWVKAYRVLEGSVLCTRDPSYAHAVLLVDGHLYDPWRGIDPEWPWSRFIWKVQQVVPVNLKKEA